MKYRDCITAFVVQKPQTMLSKAVLQLRDFKLHTLVSPTILIVLSACATATVTLNGPSLSENSRESDFNGSEILSREVELPTLFSSRPMRPSDYFTCYFTAVNKEENTITEMRFDTLINDMLIFRGSVKPLDKSETLALDLSIPSWMTLNPKKVGRGTYYIEVSKSETPTNQKYISNFMVYNSRNFKDQTSSVHLYTGNLLNAQGNEVEFVAQSDPEDSFGNSILTAIAQVACLKFPVAKEGRRNCQASRLPEIQRCLDSGRYPCPHAELIWNWFECRIDCSVECLYSEKECIYK